MRHIAIATLCAALAVTIAGSGAIAQEGAEQPAPATRPTRAYLVALEAFSAPSLDSLADYQHNRYGIPVEVLPQLPIGGGEMSLLRRQVVAEELISLMRRSYPDIANDPDAAVIGFTTFDMYAYGVTAPFVFDWRQDGRFAVVSSSHMDPNNYLRPVDPELMRSRVQKMVTRNVGLLMFGLQLNGDPSSVLSTNVASLEDLDRLGSELPL